MPKIKKTIKPKHVPKNGAYCVGAGKLDPFSKAVAETLIRKGKYTGRHVAELVKGMQSSPSVKLLLWNMGFEPVISKQLVLRLRRKMKVGAVGHYKKSVGSELDPNALRMARNLFWATDLSAGRISKIMDLVGKPVSRTTALKLMRAEGKIIRDTTLVVRERNKRIKEFAKKFKAKPMPKRIKTWVRLKDVIKILKRAHSLQENSGVKKHLNKEMSNVFELLEALEPLLPKEIMAVEAAKLLKALDRRGR